ncbi:putative MFS-type transporter C09D4.1-like protein [Leptotrombidium deliense]|uniref:Putative MFS-type transporter C09D4.1-like protein n=1 Tax=Leptotrombidium deliense TaxID=299467 RepID=A0A443S007_9ACAR|nr:putative MFS-type transporter C09D4.1-like protein [Leptotrombidium deliense]
MFTILLNQILMTEFPNDAKMVTINGILFTTSGIIGSLLFPYLLDKFKKFKLIAVLSFLTTLWSLSALVVSIYFKQRIFIYISTAAFGATIIGFTSIAVDIVVDLTYPCPEGTSIGIMYWLSAIPPIILTPIASELIEGLGIYPAFALLAALLVIGTLLLLCGQWKLKRQKMEEQRPMLQF